jgi:rubrerythrin
MAGSIDVRGITRSAFLVRGAFAAGGLYGAGAVAPVVERALAAGGGGDEAILNFALTLEHVEAAFYQRALAVRGVSGAVKRALREIAAHEAAHVQQLTLTLQQLGAQAAAAPRTSFPSLGSERAALSLAVKLEETGVGAYNGAAPLIQSPDLLGAAASIVNVEARHAGALRELAGMDPAPVSFDRSLSRAQVLAAVKPFVKGGA